MDTIQLLTTHTVISKSEPDTIVTNNAKSDTPTRKEPEEYLPRMLDTSPVTIKTNMSRAETPPPMSPSLATPSPMMGLTEFPPLLHDELNSPKTPTPAREVFQVTPSPKYLTPPDLTGVEYSSPTTTTTTTVPATPIPTTVAPAQNTTPPSSPALGFLSNLFGRKSPTDEETHATEDTAAEDDEFVPVYTTMSLRFPSTIGMFANTTLSPQMDELQRLRMIALRDESTLDTVNACMTLFLDTDRVSDKHRIEMAERLKVHARTNIGRNLIMQTGCIPNITFLLVDVGTVESACNLIINLSFTHHESKQLSDALIEAGVMTRLSWILEFAAEPTKCAAIKALTNLVIGDDGRKELLVHTEGFLDKFIRCISSPAQNVAVDAARLFCNLIKDDHNKIRPSQLEPFLHHNIATAIATNLTPTNTTFVTMIMVVLIKILLGANGSFYTEFLDAGGEAKVTAIIKSCTNTLGYVKAPFKRQYETFRLIKRQLEELGTMVKNTREIDAFEAAEAELVEHVDGEDGDDDAEMNNVDVVTNGAAALAFVTSLLDLTRGTTAPSYYSIKSMVANKFGESTLLACKEDVQKMLETFYLGRCVDQSAAAQSQPVPPETAQQIGEEMVTDIMKSALEQLGLAAKQEAEEAESKRAAREEVERFAWS